MFRPRTTLLIAVIAAALWLTTQVTATPEPPAYRFCDGNVEPIDVADTAQWACPDGHIRLVR